jgi:hypothetical protein
MRGLIAMAYTHVLGCFDTLPRQIIAFVQCNARPTIRLPNDQVSVANVICFMKVLHLLGWEYTFLGAYFFLWRKVLYFVMKCNFCHPGTTSVFIAEQSFHLYS